MRGREHTPRLKTVNRVLARLIGHVCRGARRARARRAQAAAGTATGRHEACRHAAAPAGRAQPRAGQPRAVWRLWAHTCHCSMGWGAPSRVASRRRSSSRRRFGQAQAKGYSTHIRPVSRGWRPRREIHYTLCARGLFPFDQRGELLALGDLDISGAAALASCRPRKCPPSCRRFPTKSASVRRNPTCTVNAARGGRLCVTTQRLERTGHGHTGAQDDSARRRKALLQLPSAVLCRGCHALARHCAQREERTGTDLATT